MKYLLSVGALALGIALLGAVPAYADDGGDEGTTTQASTQDNPNERICRRVRVTGSNIPQRVCMSRAEWTELREESQEDLRDNRRDTGSNLSTNDGS
jgi:hypothetical protein